MLTLNWLKNEDSVVYGSDGQLVPMLAKNLMIPDPQRKIDAFRLAPVKEGVTVRGGRRSGVLMFVPDLYFDDDIVMGGNTWLYLGEMRPPYCIFKPWDADTQSAVERLR